MLTTSVEIAPGTVVTVAELAPVSLLVDARLVGAGAVELKIATSPTVVFAGIVASTPPVLFDVSVMEATPLDVNLPS
jgi:hypothetical protein